MYQRKVLFFVFIGALFACAKPGRFSQDDANKVFPYDGGVVSGSDSWPSATPCPDTPCPPDMFCYQGNCIQDHGICNTDNDCINDSYCDQGRCIPYGSGNKDWSQDCKGQSFSAQNFDAPITKCKWTNESVFSTPIVIDLDGDQKPEILFITLGPDNESGKLVAIRGDTCQQVFTTGIYFYLASFSHLAVADLTGDKVPEIVGINVDQHIVVFNNKGNKLATSPQAAFTNNYSYPGGAPAIANLDGQGQPEIVYGGMALSYANGQLTTLYNVPVKGGYFGGISAVADVDLDGTPDIVVGNMILDGKTGADKTPSSVKQLFGGYPAVAQFDNSTPEPEVVLISSMAGIAGEIRIYNPVTGNIIFGPYSFGQQWGGPPTVADFDGDGQPEVGVAGYVGYVVFDQQCANKPLPTFCESPGVRWTKPTKDKTSGSTGSSVFDFNGDGIAEVIYRDECWLRIFDGPTGKVRFATFMTSGTILEMPVIADVDNDGHADLVSASNIYGGGACWKEADLGLSPGSPTQGVFVLQDPLNRWMPSRAIWNQHTYHITNINDDGTVPVQEQNNWLTWNNYRQNVQGPVAPNGTDSPDLTGGQHTSIDPSPNCINEWVLKAKICNRGAANVLLGVPGTFYRGDPRSNGQPICTAYTTKPLAPGECELVSCSYQNPPTGTIDLWFVADDDGSNVSTLDECKEGNNFLHLPEASCVDTQIIT